MSLVVSSRSAAIPSLGARRNGTQQTVLLAIRAGGEKDRVGAKIRATVGVAANTKAPQPVDDDRLPQGVANLVDEFSGSRIVSVDVTVTEVSYQQLITECPEIRGRPNQLLNRFVSFHRFLSAKRSLGRRTRAASTSMRG